MEKDFIPYEEALALKELGFDEKCFCNWEESWSPELEHEIRMVLTTDQTWLRPGWISAPTFSQAFRWFREKHNLRCQINYIGGLINESTWWDISIIGHYNMDPKEWEMKYQPYEEAELACLRKLIELIKINEKANNRKNGVGIIDTYDNREVSVPIDSLLQTTQNFADATSNTTSPIPILGKNVATLPNLYAIIGSGFIALFNTISIAK